MPVILRLLSSLRKYWIATSVAVVSLVLAVAIEIAVPELIRWVIDCGIRAGQDTGSASARCPVGLDPMGVVARAALFVVGLTVLKGLFQFGHGYLGEYGAQGIAYDLRDQLYQHLQRLSFSWHDRAQTGQLMARATSDVEQLRNFTGRAFMQLLQIITMSVAIIIVLFAINWKLAIVSILVLPLLIRTVSSYQSRVRPLFNQVQEELAILAGIVQENLAGSKVVKAFAREPDEIRKFDQQNDRLLAEYVAAARVQSFTNPFMDVVANLGTVIVLWYGGFLVMQSEITVGELVAFNAYLLLISRPIRRLGFLISQTARATAAAERIFEVLDAPVEVADKPNAQPLPPIRGQVTFDRVSVAYYGGQRVLNEVSFETKPGQVVALLGATGSGKSSIVNLIPRFYDVTQGRVLIDGHDVRDVQISSLRRQIGMVLQDTTLFTGTIRENIAFGAPGATEEQVVAMAKAARAHDFIMSFPRGYETRVGERGVTLSGGQKQRVAIARALLLDPRILILDDFTSAVDTETEALIREALNVLMEGRTTFVIAQRVSTVQSADQILVLDHGQIVGMGSHEELLESNPIYAEIYRLQLMDESVEEAFGAQQAAALVGATAWRAAHGHDDGPHSKPPNGNGVGIAAGHPATQANGAASNGHTTSGRNA